MSATPAENESSKYQPTSPQSENKARKNTILFVLAPVFLISLLTVGIRYVNDMEARVERESVRDAEQFRLNRVSLEKDPKKRAARKPNVPRPYPADKPTQTAIASVILAQLDAIRSLDFKKALTYSMPEMRQSTSPEAFGTMIRRSYPVMLASKKVIVGPAQIRANISGEMQTFVSVSIFTKDGNRTPYGYMLSREGKTWTVQTVIPQMPPMEAGGPGKGSAGQPGISTE